MSERDQLAALQAENARLIALLDGHGIEWRLPQEAGIQNVFRHLAIDQARTVAFNLGSQQNAWSTTRHQYFKNKMGFGFSNTAPSLCTGPVQQ